MKSRWNAFLRAFVIFVSVIALGYTYVGNAKQTASTGQISWKKYSQSIFTKATQQHKYVLLYGYAPWCRFCQQMQISLDDPEVSNLISTKFIPVKINVDSDGDLARQYNINGFPVIIILDGKQEVVGEFKGYLPVSDLLDKLRSI